MLAGDPASPYPSAKWDRSCGFTTLRAAVAARRTEDRRACSIVGATPVWLPFNYGDYPRGADEKTMLAALRDAVAGSALVLVPGYPLSHADHRWLARLCLSHGFPTGRIGLYAEQPYTWWASGEPSEIPEPIADLLTSPLKWVRARAAPATLLRKAAACLAYTSQARGLGRVPILRTIASDTKRGGEAIAWLPGQA